VLNEDGLTIHQFKGKISPVLIDNGLWANMIHGNQCSPILTDEGKELIPSGYEDIEFYKYVIVAKRTDDDKLSIYTQQGKKTTKTTYDEIDETETGLFIATTDKDDEEIYALISPQGKLLTKTQYADIQNIQPENTEKLLFKARKKEMWGILNEKGKEISPFLYQQDIKVCSNNTLIIKNKDWKYGVVSLKGKTIIPCEYDYLIEHTDTTYTYKKGDKNGILNMDGVEVGK
jgi:hypothetical protein